MEETHQVVTLYDKLNWKKHIEKQTKKAQIALSTGRRMIGTRWGLQPKQTEWLYKGTVRPILTYGSTVWINSLEKNCTNKTLEKIQRTACLMITGAMKSTPTAGMEALLNMTPLHIHIKNHILLYKAETNQHFETKRGRTTMEKRTYICNKTDSRRLGRTAHTK